MTFEVEFEFEIGMVIKCHQLVLVPLLKESNVCTILLQRLQQGHVGESLFILNCLDCFYDFLYFDTKDLSVWLFGYQCASRNERL